MTPAPSAAPAAAAAASSAAVAPPGPRIYDLDGLLALDLPRRMPLFGPVLAEAGLLLLRGGAGVGKSWLALSLAYALAGGGAVLGWQAARRARVVLVDGATPVEALQDRLRAIRAGQDAAPEPGALRVLAAEAQRAAPIDLATRLGRAMVERALRPAADCLVLDSLDSLLPPRPTPAAWAELALWLRELRRRGTAVVIVGSGRAPRALAPLLDAVVTLAVAKDWDAARGASVEIRLDSARRRAGRSAHRFAATLGVRDGAAAWERQWFLPNPMIALLLHERGLSVRKVAGRLGISAGHAAKLVAEGRRISREFAGPLRTEAEAVLADWDPETPPARKARRAAATREPVETEESAGSGDIAESAESRESEESGESVESVESVESQATPPPERAFLIDLHDLLRADLADGSDAAPVSGRAPPDPPDPS